MATRSIVQGRQGASRSKILRARQMRRERTPAEEILWKAVRGNRLGPHVRNQHVLLGWIVDFYVPQARLVIEVDGDVHDLQADDDQRRTDELSRFGVRVLRFRNEAVVNDLAGVVGAIVNAICDERK